MLSRSGSLLTDAPVSVIPQRRREPEEIIDVDELDDLPVVNSRSGSAAPRPRPPALRRARTDVSHSHSQSPRPRPRPHQHFALNAQDPIILIDSDDDDELQLVGTSSAARRSARRLNHPTNRTASSTSTPRSRLFSPPPPLRDVPVVVIPPVPQVPRQYAALQGLPHRDRRPPFPASANAESSSSNSRTPPAAGVIRPIEQPYGFEAAIRERNARRHQHHHHHLPHSHVQERREEGDVPRAAPRSYHIPHMGFGGAIITSNRARLEQERRDRRHGVFNNPSAAALDLLALGLHGNGPEDLQEMQALEALMMENERTGPRLFIPQDRMERLRRQREEQEYQAKFTHPKPVEPGFTFDFAPREKDDNGGVQGRLFPRTSRDDPIVIDDDSEDEVTALAGGEARPSLTTLLVCARCMDPLVLGGNLSADESRQCRIWGLRCGHMIDEKCLDQMGIPPPMPGDESDAPAGAGETVKVDRKGKGKARAVDIAEDEDFHMPGGFPDGGIRSRLRSRSSVSSSSLPYPAPKRAKTRSKRKAKPGTVEDTYEWICPVPGCGRVHVSALVDGVWGPERDTKGEGRGAIAVFV